MGKPLFMRAMLQIEDNSPPLKESGLTDFSSFMQFEGGELVTLQRGRTVTRIAMDGRAFYLKRNRFNWREFIKSIVHLKWPPRNAVTEYHNIAAVGRLGIPTVAPVAVGEKRLFGLEIESFILTEELYDAEPLESIVQRELSGPISRPKRQWKQSLVRKVAQIARNMHSNGLCHQDFYLGHFFLGREGTLHLIDLQRVLRHNKLRRRYVVKDLGQLNYSADFVGNISRTDRMRFFMHYLDLPSLGPAEKDLARSITAKTDRIAKHTVKLLERRRRRGEIL